MASGGDGKLTEAEILSSLDERTGNISQPLLSKDHNTFIKPPPLLPGETLILQQDNVTCINTLWRPATGVLHLTNYRIIFAGEFMQKFNASVLILDSDHLTKLGYKYQEKKTMFQNVSPNLRKLMQGKSRSLKVMRKAKKEDLKWTSNKLHKAGGSLDKIEKSTIQIFQQHQTSSGTRKKSNLYNDNETTISLPILSLLDIRKYPKQYLEVEKLQMLNDGIEIITTNFLSIKLCLGEEMSYDAEELLCRLLKHTKVKSSSIFAYVHKGNILLPKSCCFWDDSTAPNVYDIEKETFRLDMCGPSDWKLTDQCTCQHYPKKVLLPSHALETNKLKEWSNYYRDNCYPLIVWSHVKSRTFLMRSSVTTCSRGDKDYRCIIDEDIIRNIRNENTQSGKLVIYTESKTALSTNGSYYNFKEPLFYPHCEVVIWDNLPDIFSTQQCAMKLLTALAKGDDCQYLRSIEDSGYLQEISILLDYSQCVVATLNKSCSHVLLSIGSGTERVAQISSLVQLLMDPYYRTLDGFQILIQKEWCSIDFPFKKRNLIDFSCEEELSPLFLQFLDCVWQIMKQYPLTFQFSDQLLELLAEHSYSGRFGTFLNETEESRSATLSIWSYIRLVSATTDSLFNYNYDKHQISGILQPLVGIPHLGIWSWYNRYRKDKNLLVHSMFAVIELEKLQKEYEGLLERHSNLLKSLSNVDEFSSISFNSRCCSTPDITDGTTNSQSAENSSEGEDEVFREALGNKWESMDSLLKNGTLSNGVSKVEKYGNSSFYHPPDDGISAINLLKELRHKSSTEEWKGSERFHSLNEYLVNEGIQVEGVKDVQISKMTCCGYLVKRGSNYKSWKRRWFMIDFRKKFVGYYDHSSAPTPKGVFSYMGISSVYPAKNKQDKFLFKVETFERTYHIRAPNERAMNIWITCFSVPVSCLAQT